MTKISVIIPVYNAEKYLARCLDSVCNQTLQDIEVLCVNDCSPDNSLAILEDYAQKDSRIKIINRKQNGGESAARNTGIEAAIGEYIAFLDNDDAVDKDFYEKLYANGIKENADISKGEAYTIEYNKSKIYDNINEEIRKFNSKLCFIDHWWSAIYRKSLIDKHNLRLLEGCPLGADVLFLNQAVLYANKLVMVDKTYYQYYHREDSGNSSKLSIAKIDSVLEILNSVSENTNKLAGDDREGINYINHWAVRSALHYISRNLEEDSQSKCINLAEALWKQYIEFNLIHNLKGIEREKNILAEDICSQAETYTKNAKKQYLRLLKLCEEIKKYTKVPKDEKIKLLFDAEVLRLGDQDEKVKRGIYWVAYNLLKYFLKDERFDVTLVVGSSYLINFYKKDEAFENVKSICPSFKLGAGGNNRIIPNLKFHSYDYDCYFNPAHNSKLAHSNSFYMLYDAMPMFDNGWFPHAFTNVFYNFHHDLSPYTYYFSDSANSKNDFLKYFDNMRDDNISVAPISSSQDFKVIENPIQLQSVFDKYQTGLDSDSKYIFYMGAVDDKRKNLVGSVKHFIDFIDKNNINDLYFLLGGNGKEKLVDSLEKQLGQKYEKYAKYIIPLGFVDVEDVNILYSHSLFFMFLSLYEGFGMPPLEAMMSGTPVICADNSSLPEVVGDAGILVNVNNDEQILEALKTFYYDEEKRKEYIEKGLKRAAMFSWEKTYKIISDKIIKELKGEI